MKNRLFLVAFSFCVLLMTALVTMATFANTPIVSAKTDDKAERITLHCNGVTVKDTEDRTRVTTLVASDLSGTWWTHPDMKSQVTVYASKSQGAVIGFYRDTGNVKAGCDFAISATKDGAQFQVVDDTGKAHLIPVTALLKLKQLKD